MKLLIAGSRDLHVSVDFIGETLDRLNLFPAEIVSGGAKGIDSCAQRYAQDRRMMFALFEADWNKNGKMAGPIRNLSMALYSDALLLIWDGKSKGSANMKARMEGLRKPVYEIILKGGI